MPTVQCPDCFRQIRITEADMVLVIECAMCKARIGPMIQRADGIALNPTAPRPVRERESERRAIAVEPAEPLYADPIYLDNTELGAPVANGRTADNLAKSSSSIWTVVLGIEAALFFTLLTIVIVVGLYKAGAFESVATPPAGAPAAKGAPRGAE